MSCTGVEFPDTEPQGNLGSGFAWASDNWQISAPDPVIAVESIGYSANGPVRDTFPERPSLAALHLLQRLRRRLGTGLDVVHVRRRGPARHLLHQSRARRWRRRSSPASPGSWLRGTQPVGRPDSSSASSSGPIADTTNGAAPRVDAFAPLLSLDGAARALVDVNDPSNDGNRRIAYNRDGTIALVDTVESERDRSSRPTPTA